MIQRCTNPSAKSFHNYGDRGIKVYPGWMGHEGFDAFLRHVGPRPANRSLDRIDNDKGYAPGNVRWASPSEQAQNMRVNHLLSFHGETMSISAWARKLKINYYTLHSRIVTKKWSVEKALTVKPGKAIKPLRRLAQKNNVSLTFKGETLPAMTWAERLGIPYSTVYARIGYGWPPDRVLRARAAQ